MNHDRRDTARSHVKDSGDSRCAVCRNPWPCLTAFLVRELDRAEKRAAVAKQKPPIPDAREQRRPIVSRRTSSWSMRDKVNQARWVAGAAGFVADVIGTVMRRADEDADGGISAVGLSGSRGGGDSSPTEARALAHERLIRHPETKEVIGVKWDDDNIPRAEAILAELVGEIGDRLVRAVAMARMLYGITPADAKELLNKGGACQNPNCGAWKENDGAAGERLIVWDRDGLRRCEPCYRYVRAHNGEERPVHLCRAA